MKYCTGCGRAVPDHVKFCGQCGCGSFSAVPAEETRATATVTAAHNAPDDGQAYGQYGGGSVEETAFAENGYDYGAVYGSNGYDPGGSYGCYDGSGDTAYMDYNYSGDYPATGDDSGSGDGKKPLMIAMISLAGVLVVLCVVLAVVFFRNPKPSVGTTSRREIPTGVDAAEEATRVAETLTAAPATAPVYTAPATAPVYTAPAVTKPAATVPAATKPATTKPATTKPATTKPTTAKPTAAPQPAPLVAPTSTQDILALYSNAVNSVADGAAGCTVKQVRSIGNVNLVEDAAVNELLKIALGQAFTPEDAVDAGVYGKGDAEIRDDFPAWRLQNPALVSSAVCSVSGGNYVVQIKMPDERNPAADSPLSQVSDMVDSYDDINEMVRAALEVQGQDAGDASFDLTYSNYTIDAVITPDGRLVSLRHSDTVTVTTHNLYVDLGIELDLDNKSFSWNSSKEYTNFTY